MEKTPRYTQRERNMVLGFAAQYRDVIENKRTDAESNRKKDDVWRLIAKEFNARVYHQRTSKQLRQLYKNMKLLLKKDLCHNDGKSTKSFIEILTSLSQQNSVSQFMSTSPTPGYNGRPIGDYDNDKLNFNNSQNDSDVVVIKSEDISDNEQSSSIRNDMDMEDEDDCLSSKDIPEVCLEEEDDDIFGRTPPDLLIPLQHGKGLNDNSSTNKSDFLLVLAIEERKRKIELLNAQIEYWKTLTKKLEVNSGSGSTSNSTPACHCHLPPRMNGVNQS